MAVESKDQLKTYFETNDKPTQQQFINLIDSLAHVDDVPTVPTITDRKGIIKTADIGDGPTLTYPIEDFASLGTQYFGLVVINEEGYTEIMSPQFIPAENPTSVKVDVGGVLTEKLKLYFK